MQPGIPAPAQQGIPGQLGDPLATESQPQESWSRCRAFTKNEDESWTCNYFVAFDTSGQQIEVCLGTTFIPGPGFLGFDMTE